MKAIGNPLELVAKNAASFNPKTDGDYTGPDGLLYCGKCYTPKQIKVKLDIFDPPQERIFPVVCQCRKAELDREEAFMKNQKEMVRLGELRNASLMDNKFRESTFQSFVQTKNNARVLKLCKRYAEGFDEMLKKNQGLLLWGGFGTGKTFAAACIANYLLSQMIPVVMTSFVKILQRIQNFRSDEEEQKFLSRISRAKLLIIDDLGTERNTDYALERVYGIIDSRYREGKPLILTTNLTLDQMRETLDVRYGRIYDRIFEMCYPIEFTGQSWRKREAANRFEAMTKFLEGD